jgi:hypothetical protein
MKGPEEDKRFIRSLKQALDELEVGNLSDEVRELKEIYTRFSFKSARVLRALSRFMPDSKARLYLTDHVLDLLDSKGPMSIKELLSEALSTFEYKITPRSLYNSVYTLVKTGRVKRYYDTGKRKTVLAIAERGT